MSLYVRDTWQILTRVLDRVSKNDLICVKVLDKDRNA